MGGIQLRRIFACCCCLVVATVIYLCRIDVTKSMPPRFRRIRPVAKHPLYPSNWTLVDLEHFEFLLNSDVCQKNESVRMLISVTSHPGHVTLRQAFRRALPSHVLSQFGIRRIFILARIDPRQSGYQQVNQSVVEEEHLRYGDVIQGDFGESYRHLTYKHILGLKYAVHYCPRAKFVLKMDDDIAVDVFRVLDLLDDNQMEGSLKILGALMNAEERLPLRDTNSKWYVTYDEYPHQSYPPFVSGWAYATSLKGAGHLVAQSERSPFFWIDDVYVTGLLANLSSLEFVDMRSQMTTFQQRIQCCVERPNVECDYLVGPSPNVRVLEEFYRQILQCYTNGCAQNVGRFHPMCVTAVQPDGTRPEPGTVVQGQVIPLTL